MKKLIVATITCTLLACDGSGFNDSLIESVIASGTSAGLKLAITNDTKRTEVANYLNNYAGALRTITGTPTPEELTNIINSHIPANIRQQFPEIEAIATPLIVAQYTAFIHQHGKDAATVYHYFNVAATGLETGAACCTSPH